MKQIPTRADTPVRSNLPVKRMVRWASQPFVGKLGLYIGISYEAGSISVAVQTVGGHPRWVPSIEALTEAEAESWKATGFGRRL
jgi:hypothetical protein